jgi:WD repeat-containing protein 59
MCRHNKSVAEEFGTADIVQVWSLAEMISQPNNDPDEYDDMMCFQNPFAKNLLESL